MEQTRINNLWSRVPPGIRKPMQGLFIAAGVALLAGCAGQAPRDVGAALNQSGNDNHQTVVQEKPPQKPPAAVKNDETKEEKARSKALAQELKRMYPRKELRPPYDKSDRLTAHAIYARDANGIVYGEVEEISARGLKFMRKKPYVIGWVYCAAQGVLSNDYVYKFFTKPTMFPAEGAFIADDAGNDTFVDFQKGYEVAQVYYNAKCIDDRAHFERGLTVYLEKEKIHDEVEKKIQSAQQAKEKHHGKTIKKSSKGKKDHKAVTGKSHHKKTKAKKHHGAKKGTVPQHIQSPVVPLPEPVVPTTPPVIVPTPPSQPSASPCLSSPDCYQNRSETEGRAPQPGPVVPPVGNLLPIAPPDKENQGEPSVKTDGKGTEQTATTGQQDNKTKKERKAAQKAERLAKLKAAREARAARKAAAAQQEVSQPQPDVAPSLPSTTTPVQPTAPVGPSTPTPDDTPPTQGSVGSDHQDAAPPPDVHKTTLPLGAYDPLRTVQRGRDDGFNVVNKLSNEAHNAAVAMVMPRKVMGLNKGWYQARRPRKKGMTTATVLGLKI